jgi:putative membrane-bound dehydrogenase-like protein
MMKRFYWLLWLPMLLCAFAAETLPTFAAEPAVKGKPTEKDTPDKDYSSELPRIPRTTPADALKTFAVQPGFRIEQIAAEPLVASPVAIAFDENGKLYVVEMRDYSENRDDHLGRVRLLEDTDGDSRMDRSTIFVEGLPWPTAVACYDGGVFVGAAPDIWYFKDTNGDGKADERRVVFTGFHLTNVQGLLNSFQWSLNNRIEGSASSCGADVRPAADAPAADTNAKPLTLRGQDFSIEPRGMTIVPVSGGGQHGMSFDRWGNKFIASNSNHIQLIHYESRYIARNPYLAAPGASRGIAADGPAAEVFRTSPVEPWRIVRTRLRISGVAPGMIEGGGRAAGYFTGATGVTIYRGDAFPAEYQGNAFIGDVGSNLVHRKTLESDGVSQIARRADQGREFLTSRDIWFRPVQFANAPDGALYVIDMSREVIEHPASVPPMIKKHLDLTSGREQGRIYRIVPEGFKQPKPVRLGQATTKELVALVAHTNGWHRDTAARLLYQRQDKSAVEPLEKLAGESQLPEGRMTALYVLDGLGALRPEIVLARLGDPHPRIRKHAVRLAERVLDDAAVRAKLYTLVADDDPRVRYQLAFTLGEVQEAACLIALASLAKRDAADSWQRLAIRSSLADGTGEVFATLVADAGFRKSAAGRTFLEELARQIGAQDRKADVALLVRALQSVANENDLAQIVMRGAMQGAGPKSADLGKQLSAATGGKADALLAELVAKSIVIAQDAERTENDRVDAIRSLSIGKFAAVHAALASLVDPRQPQGVQVAAMSALGKYDDPAVAATILGAFDSLSPRLRSEALEALLARPHRSLALLQTISAGKFAASNIDPARTKLLVEHSDSAVRELAAKTLANAKLGRRADVIAAYQDSLKLDGDVERGRQTFRKICAACHRLENVGHEIGLNLATIRNRGPEAILVNVLDPNREVDPRYLNYTVVTDDGRSLTGVIAAETATSITLKRPENATDALLRINIDQLRSTGQSIMPEGLEKQIDKQAMADVIAYLLSIK